MTKMAEEHDEIFQSLAEKSGRYHREAYSFTHEAFDFTMADRQRPAPVDGRELCAGIRKYAEKSFGYLSRTVFAHWGVTSTEDFGEIVADMMGVGLLERNDESKEQFAGVYDFEEVFEQQLLYD